MAMAIRHRHEHVDGGMPLGHGRMAAILREEMPVYDMSTACDEPIGRWRKVRPAREMGGGWKRSRKGGKRRGTVRDRSSGTGSAGTAVHDGLPHNRGKAVPALRGGKGVGRRGDARRTGSRSPSRRKKPLHVGVLPAFDGPDTGPRSSLWQSSPAPNVDS
jgi:hypothetical protein